MTSYWLVQVEDDNGNKEINNLGPYTSDSEQIEAARVIRDTDETVLVLWLDIEYGIPTVGAFDPQFYTEGDW